MTTIINTGEAPGAKSRRRLAEMLYAQGTGNEPIQHWMQGVAKLAQAGIGGYQLSQIDQEERDRDAAAQKLLLEAPGLAPSGANATRPEAPTPPGVAPAATPNYGNAIASIESGGKYDALGPVTKSGDRAYGKYQVMGANVPEWSRTHLGQEMTPDQFLASPQAQDAVFKGQFGQYANKYGPEGAARAWFAGEGGMNNPNARDQLGTTVSSYAQKFNKSLGGERPYDVAGPAVAGPAAAAPPQSAGVIPPDQANYIRRLMSNPATRDYGTALYQKAMTEAEAVNKPTDEIREFQYAQRNPAFKDYKTDLKRAGAIQNQVMIDQKGENEFSKEGGKIQAKRFGELAEDAPSAKQMISDIDTLRTLGSQIDTGKSAEAKARFGPYAESLGIKVDGLSEIQAYEAIVNRLAPTLRVKGSGAQSDYELKGFLKSLPSLGNTPGGNEMTSQVLQGLAENKLRAAEIGGRALSGQISRPDAEKALRELPDPMEGYRAFIKRTKPAAAKAQTDIRQKYGLE